MLKIFCDGGARGNPGPAACAIAVFDGEVVIYKTSKYLGVATNNVAEYESVLLGLHYLTNNLPDKDVVFILDSQLVARQMSGVYKIKNEKLRGLFVKAKTLENLLPIKISYTSVAREQNTVADALVNEALDENP